MDLNNHRTAPRNPAWDDSLPADPQPLIHGQSTSEATWVPWLAGTKLPIHTLPHWLPASARLVVLAPHPGSEILACGTLLAMHAARGGSVLLIAITDGEASHPACPERSAAQLAATRRSESETGWLRLGLQGAAVIRMGLPDGEIRQHSGQLVATLRRCLRPTDAVVSTWRQDGHLDDEATGRCAAKVCAVVGCSLLEAPVWMWHWASPGDARVPWHRLQCLETDPTAWTRKQTALAAHRSQLSALSPQHPSPAAALNGHSFSAVEADIAWTQQPVLGSAILARARRHTEYFFV